LQGTFQQSPLNLRPVFAQGTSYKPAARKRDNKIAASNGDDEILISDFAKLEIAPQARGIIRAFAVDS